MSIITGKKGGVPIKAILKRFISVFFVISIFIPYGILAEETAQDLLRQELKASGVENHNQVIQATEKTMGGSLSAIPLHDRIDFSSFPYAKVNVSKLDVPACLVLTPEAVNYVFKGKPDSFQGSFRKYEFHIGEGLNKAARMIYPQVFSTITAAGSLAAAGPNEIAVVPETVDFHFRMGGAFRPSLIASIKIKVGMYQAGKKFFEKTYEVNDVKKSSYTIFPSKKQEHKAISKAIIDALKLNAEEIAMVPEVAAMVNQYKGKQVVASTTVQPPENKSAPSKQWVEDTGKYDFDDKTEQWIRENQHQIARSENQSTRDLLKKETATLPPPAEAAVETGTVETEVVVAQAAEPAIDDTESDYVPLPEASVFVPTEAEKKRWAERKAQIERSRAQREKENREFEREDKMAAIKINETYANRLRDNNWVYNNVVSETIIDHGGDIILATKTGVVIFACAGPQAAVTCAPVTSTMVSYGRFDSLAAGIGEGTAEYQKSGDLTKAMTKGAVTGALDYAAGWAGGKATKAAGAKAMANSKAFTEGVSDTVRKQAFERTKSQTSGFVLDAVDNRVRKHLYKVNKNVVQQGMKRAAVDGFGADAGKRINSAMGIDEKDIKSVVDKFNDSQPKGRPLNGEN